MTTAIRRAPVRKTGARPVQGPSRTEVSRQKALSCFRKVGTYVRVKMAELEEGDIFANHLGTFCLLRKESVSRRGSLVSVRDMQTKDVKSVTFDPLSRLLRVQLPEIVEHDGLRWRIRSGDVVSFPESGSVAIRHNRAWHPTAGPWLPLGDAEVLLALREKRAFILRNSIRQGEKEVPENLALGTVVATRDPAAREPSVFIQTAPDYWTGNSRGAALSTMMVKYELNRRTYQVLRKPEVGK